MKDKIFKVPVFGLKPNEVYPVIKNPQTYLSFYDLEGTVGFMSCKETQDEQWLEDVLWRYGVDISETYYLEKCLHRPRTSNVPYNGFRVVGRERTDKNWLVDGAPSLEAQLFTKDESLAEVLASLDPTNARNKKRDYDEDAECSVEVSQ